MGEFTNGIMMDLLVTARAYSAWPYASSRYTNGNFFQISPFKETPVDLYLGG